MGNDTSRLSASGHKLQSDILEKPFPPSDAGLVEDRILRRAVSKITNAFSRGLSRSLKASLDSKRPSTVQSQVPQKDMEAPRQRHLLDMDVIEILDDYDEAITISDSDEVERSSVTGSIQYISSAESSEQENSSDGFGSPRPQSLHSEAWAYGIPRPDANAVENQVNFAQPEPDWRDFLDDAGPFKGEDDEEPNATILDISHQNSDGLDFSVPNPQFSQAAQLSPKEDCVVDVLNVFPDMCREYVSDLYDIGFGKTAEQLVAYVLDQLDNGSGYPKAKDKLRALKRKREVDEDEEALSKYANIDRENGSHGYTTLTFVDRLSSAYL
jgi:hypothetical protein